MYETLLLSQTRDILLLIDPVTLAIRQVSEPTLNALGYSRDALLGRSITELECGLSDLFYWDEVRQGGNPNVSDTECSYLCSNGDVLLVSKTVSRVENGTQSWLVIRAESLELRQQAENELASISSSLQATLEATAEGILLLDRSGNIQNMNQRFSKMWGFPDALLARRVDREAFGFMASLFADPLAYERDLAKIYLDFEDESFDTLELADGRIFERRSRPARHAKQIIGRVFSFTDVTERKAIEQQILNQNAQLEEQVLQRTAALNRQLTALTELNRKLEDAQFQLLQSEKLASLGQLAAGVAHEINNPIGFINSNLNTLGGYVESLLSIDAGYAAAQRALAPDLQQGFAEVNALKISMDHSFIVDDLRQLLKESRDGLERVKTIVRDLKDFARVGSAEWLWADIHQGLESTLNIVWNELKYKAKVEREYATLPQVYCIPSQLNQVFMNLLVNAAHAIESQGVIRVCTGCNDKQVWIEVSDTGSGIAPENINRIFDPFFTTKALGKGTGLGLSLAWGIVQRHRGVIKVESEPGKGSTFRVVIAINGQSSGNAP